VASLKEGLLYYRRHRENFLKYTHEIMAQNNPVTANDRVAIGQSPITVVEKESETETETVVD
ncbi:MAG: hypothetical protein R6V42_10310, partial [Orrella sp.]